MSLLGKPLTNKVQMQTLYEQENNKSRKFQVSQHSTENNDSHHC